MKKNLRVLLGFIIFGGFLFANNVFAQTTSSSTTSGSTTTTTGGTQPIKFENPLAYNKVEDLLGNAMTVLQGIVGVLAILMIVVGGVIWTVSGTTGQTDMAKNMIKSALIGLAVVLAAPSFLKEIYKILGEPEPAQTAGKKSLYEIILSATQAVLGIVGVLAILMIVIGGVMYITNQSDTAKKIVKGAVVGLVIALTSLIVVNAIVGIF